MEGEVDQGKQSARQGDRSAWAPALRATSPGGRRRRSAWGSFTAEPSGTPSTGPSTATSSIRMCVASQILVLPYFRSPPSLYLTAIKSDLASVSNAWEGLLNSSLPVSLSLLIFHFLPGCSRSCSFLFSVTLPVDPFSDPIAFFLKLKNEVGWPINSFHKREVFDDG